MRPMTQMDEAIAKHRALMAAPMDGRRLDPCAIVCRRCGCPGANLCRHLCLTDTCGKRTTADALSFNCPCCLHMDIVLGHDAAEEAAARYAARPKQQDFFQALEKR